MPTVASVAASERDEDDLYSYLVRRRWSVEYVGQRVWGQALKTAARHHVFAAHWPDLLIGRDRSIFLVEVLNSRGRHEPFVEVAKLVALNEWSRLCPVLVADVSTRTVWTHQVDWTDKDLRSNVMTVTPRGGSGDPYCALMRPEHSDPWDVAFA
jgi:hypothetical protein